MNQAGIIRSVRLDRESVHSFEEYPFCIPSVRSLNELSLHANVTFFVGGNGSGKSTLLEAIAIAAGFNPEGGSKNFRFSTACSASSLHEYLRVVRGTHRERTGFFLRAESYFNLATEIEELDKEPSPAPLIIESYGNKPLHEQSHGESFMALVQHRFGDRGLYLLDEPEAALSPSWQLSLLRSINDLVVRGSQFIIATHSPLLLAYPHARILQFDEQGVCEKEYRETEHFQLCRAFLNSPERFLGYLFDD